MEDGSGDDHDVFVAHEEILEDDVLEVLVAENDEDAILMQLEDSMSETIQADGELSAIYSTYRTQ